MADADPAWKRGPCSVCGSKAGELCKVWFSRPPWWEYVDEPHAERVRAAEKEMNRG